MFKIGNWLGKIAQQVVWGNEKKEPIEQVKSDVGVKKQ